MENDSVPNSQPSLVDEEGITDTPGPDSAFLEDDNDDDDGSSTSTIMTDPNELTLKERLVPILVGQVASALICLSGITSVYLTQNNGGLSLPGTQNLVSYILISAIFTTRLAYSGTTRLDVGIRENFVDILKDRGWKYLLIALADVSGNYFVVKAYQYTSLTSVQLLDCFSIPTVLLLSYVFLKVRYVRFHFFGVFLCLCGIGFLIAADVEAGRTSEGTKPLLGDLLCLLGAFLYGISNVSQEYFVKNFNPVEFLGCIGIMGVIIAAIQALALEMPFALPWTTEGILLLVAFGAIQLCFYYIVAKLMRVSSSLAVNLSILSADFYSVIAGIFIFQYDFSILYILSFSLVIAGVGLFYSRKPLRRSRSQRLQGSNAGPGEAGGSQRSLISDKGTRSKNRSSYGTVSVSSVSSDIPGEGN